MENPALWLLFVVASVVIYRRFVDLSADAEARQKSIALLRAELDGLRDKLTDLTYDIERVTLTPDELQEKHFNRLPALTVDQIVPFGSGDKLLLVLKSFGGFRAVEYTHQELTYRTAGEKDAVAHGKARLDASGEFSEVRILFSRPHATATLRGLADEGQVKEGRLLPNNSFKPNPHQGGA